MIQLKINTAKKNGFNFNTEFRYFKRLLSKRKTRNANYLYINDIHYNSTTISNIKVNNKHRNIEPKQFIRMET
jgi:hypothetical protein